MLSVNGLPVWDLSYADVVYQVQLSHLRLTVRVTPRDDDALQKVRRRGARSVGRRDWRRKVLGSNLVQFDECLQAESGFR